MASLARETLYSIHVPTKTNVGDDASSPVHYIPALKEHFNVKRVSIGDASVLETIPQDAPIIIGGGGLLASKPGWDAVMTGALERSSRVVAWGVGLNRSRKAAAIAPRKLPVFADRFALFGLRDWIGVDHWVPCVSAMSGAFERQVPLARKYGFYLHVMRMDLVPEALKPLLAEDNVRSNTGDFGQLSDAVDFLASSECVITNSFHGAYWATLLGKPVILFDTFSEKFTLSRWPQEQVTDEASLDDLLARAKLYPEALEQARQANLSFAEKAMAILAR